MIEFRDRARITSFAREANRYMLAAEAIDILARVGIEAQMNPVRGANEPIVLTCYPWQGNVFADARQEAEDFVQPYEFICFLEPLGKGLMDGASARKTGLTLLSKALWIVDEAGAVDRRELENRRDLAPGGLHPRLLSQFKSSAARHRLEGFQGDELISRVTRDLRIKLIRIGTRMADMVAKTAAMALGGGAGSPFWYWPAEEVIDMATDLPTLVRQAVAMVEDEALRTTLERQMPDAELAYECAQVLTWQPGVTERNIRFASALKTVAKRA